MVFSKFFWAAFFYLQVSWLVAQSPTIYATPGTYTWTCPAGVTSVNVDLYGAGGGGGYGGTSVGNGGGGGGGGGFCSRTAIPVSCGVSYTIVIGSGGLGATATLVAGTGATTSATFGAVALTASGGIGGVNFLSGGAGGAGGVGAGGAVNRSGGSGGLGTSAGSGAGGGCAGTTGNGGPGGNAGGLGGAAGGGNAGSGANGLTTGTAVGLVGNNFGGGGSGGTRNSAGGSGAPGRVAISFTCPAAPAVNAGLDQNLAVCATTTTLSGSSIPSCMTGLWTVIAGSATITTPTSPTSGVTGLVPGTPTTLRWTITNPNCGTYFDDVIISAPIGPGCWNYCASNATSIDYSYISNVTFNTINNSSSGCASYTNFTNISTTVLIGQSYNLTIAKLNCTNAIAYTGRFAAWIDWNNDGDFVDVGEQVLTDAAASNGPLSALVTVPAGAVVGTTRMRCIFREGATAPASCGAYATWGETEDYSVNIQNLVTCSGTPTPATISPGSFTGNPGQVVTYTWNGVPQIGYTYQWQQSVSATGPWTAIPGANSTTYTTNIINVTTYFRLLITCTNSGLSATTQPAELLIAVNYCSYPTISCANGQQITRVILNNLDNTTGTTCTPTGYQDFTNLTSNLLIGSTYTMNVYTGAGANVTSGNPQYQHSMGVWIDFNQNGSFYDPGEFFLFGQNTINPNSIVNGNIVVPPTALAGNTRMRVKYTLDQTMLSAWACIDNPSPPVPYGGEVEDYTINFACPNLPTEVSGRFPFFSAQMPCGASIIMRWNEITCATGYKVFLGTSPTAMNLIGVTTNGEYPTGALSPNTTYYWAIVPFNSNGDGASTTWSFQTNTVLSTPVVNDVDLCQGSTQPISLTATGALAGNQYYWYTVSAGGQNVFIGNPYNVTPLPTTTDTIYVEQANISAELSIATHTSTNVWCGAGGTVGEFFDIKAKTRDLIITRFEVRPTAGQVGGSISRSYKVYYRTSPFADNMVNSTGWVYLGQFNVTTPGCSNPPCSLVNIDIPDFEVPAGATYGVYIVGVGSAYDLGLLDSPGLFQNVDLDVSVGVGTCGEFSPNRYADFGFSGNVYYKTKCSSARDAAIIRFLPNTIPTFTQLGPYCLNSSSVPLPTTSTNGISGVWSPATISTTTLGSQTYTFTPALSSASVPVCGTGTTMTVQISSGPTAAISYPGSPYCNSLSSAQTVTLTGTGSYIGGAYSATAGLSVNPTTGAILPSASAPGIYTVTYTVVGGGSCASVTATATVTILAPPTISGTLTVCPTQTTQLTGSATAASSNAWGSLNTSIATVSSTGLVTGVAAGTATITYTNLSGCQTTATVTVNTAPTAPAIGSITQPTCTTPTGNVSLSGLPSAGTWTVSGNPSGALTGTGTTGIVTGLSAGTTYTFTVTNSSGCVSLSSLNAVLGAQPSIPSTPSVVTAGASCSAAGTAAITNYVGAQFYIFTPIGPSVGTGGIIGGLIPGTNYTVSTSNGACPSAVSNSFSVAAQLNAPAAPIISIAPASCIAAGTATITNYFATQTYSFNPPGPSVGTGGVVSGLTPLNNYTVTTSNANCPSVPSISFAISAQLAAPTITGVTAICPNQTTQLSGTGAAASVNPWQSANTSLATVSSTGLVTGVATGIVLITYTNSAGCQASVNVTVNSLPTISGATSVCPGSIIQLTGSVAAAISSPWLSSNSPVATVSNSGLVTGVAPGNALITYTNSFGCQTTTTIVVVDVLDFVNLQFPASGTICQTSTFTAYGQIANSGIINTQGVGQAAGVTAQIGYSSTNTNPSSWTNWTDATYNSGQTVNIASNDEYAGTLSGLSPGTYYYTFRYQINNCGWQYGGYAAGGGGAWGGSNLSGTLVVQATPNAGLDANVSACATGTAVDLYNLLGSAVSINGSWTGPSALAGSYLGTFNPASNAAGVYTFTVAGGACPNDAANVTVTVTSSPAANVIYPSPICNNVTVIQTPSIIGTTGGTFSSTALSVNSATGAFNPFGVAPGTYSVNYAINIIGCSPFQASAGVTIVAPPGLPTLLPAAPCSSTDSAFTAGSGSWYEFIVDGVSTGPPSAVNTLNTAALAPGTGVCVRSYPAPAYTFNGNINEPQWGNPLSTSASGPASGFGANYLDALYLNAGGGYLYGAIAGQTENNSNNRILLFIDCIPNGFNNLSSWTDRSNAPYVSVENLGINGVISFDPGFNPDYILCMNQAGGIAYFDLYNMVSNTNYYLGSDVSDGLISTNLLGYQANGAQGNINQGFEFAVPMSLLGNPSAAVQGFVMLVNDPGFGSGTATSISNQFLTPAGAGNGNYGNLSIDFGAAPPNPISYGLPANCFTETCVTVTGPVTPLFNAIAPLCYGSVAPALPVTSTNNISGSWSPTSVSNIATGMYTFTPVAGACSTSVQLNVTVEPPIITNGIYHD